MGTATIRPMNVVINVPETSVMIPNRGLSNTGVHSVSVRKSMIETSRKNSTEFVNENIDNAGGDEHRQCRGSEQNDAY